MIHSLEERLQRGRRVGYAIDAANQGSVQEASAMTGRHRRERRDDRIRERVALSQEGGEAIEPVTKTMAHLGAGLEASRDGGNVQHLCSVEISMILTRSRVP